MILKNFIEIYLRIRIFNELQDKKYANNHFKRDVYRPKGTASGRVESINRHLWQYAFPDAGLEQ